MDNKYSPSITQTNETSYRTMNYPNINTLSFIQSKNNNKTEKNQKSNCQKLFQLNSHRSTINNKKNNNLFDEDDTKNNENFVTFLDNLLNKDESSNYLKSENLPNEDNSSIHSNHNFFLKKINTKNNIKIYNINNNKKEEDIYYSFRNNKIKNKSSTKINNDVVPFQYRLKNFMNSIPKKSRQQIIYNNINKNNIDFKNNILQTFNTEKKSIGINCQINDYFLNKQKKCSNENNDDILKLGQNLSLKQIDGRMLNKYETYIKSDENAKKNKNKTNITKYLPDNRIPKIIIYSRNKVIKDRETEHKLNTMKENVMHFLKDKSHHSSTKKNSNYITNFRNINEKNNLNKNVTIGNIFPSKTSYSPFLKFKLIYGNNKNLISYLKSFEKNYKKKINKKKLNMNNKRKLFSTLKNKNYYNINTKLENINLLIK